MNNKRMKLIGMTISNYLLVLVFFSLSFIVFSDVTTDKITISSTSLVILIVIV